MNLDIIRKKFLEYAKKYDLKDPDIMRKFHHSFRVMEYSKEIAISLNLSEEDINLASVIGLLHDIARFEQWTKYKTYSDNDSIDHGDLGFDILEDLLEEIEEKYIILKAVKNHNKFKIEDNLDDRTLLFCKIIRDADKLDIMKEQGLVITEIDDYIEDEIMESFFNKTILSNDTEDSSFNSVLRSLAFVYDMYFDYSLEFVLKNNIIENKTNLLSIYSTEIEKIEYIKNDLSKYINNRLGK